MKVWHTYSLKVDFLTAIKVEKESQSTDYTRNQARTAILAATTLNAATNEAKLDICTPVVAAPVLLLFDVTEPVL